MRGHNEEEFDYSLFWKRAVTAAIAADLISPLVGIEKNDVVSVILPNLPQSYFAIWGAEAAGIVNPINPMLEPEVMVDIMNAAGAKVLVTLAYFPTTDIWHKVASIADQVPTLETILTVDLANYLHQYRNSRQIESI